MGWSMFIEEPGDHQAALPYGVLAGIAVEDRLVWQLARKLRDAETQFFGLRLEQAHPHFTTEALLNADVVQHSASSPPLNPTARAILIKEYFNDGRPEMSRKHVYALAQARYMFCHYALETLISYDAKAFAIFIPAGQINITYKNQLRKDYAFLFERFSYFLRDQPSENIGKLVLDASRHTGKYVSIPTITDYFEKTTKGRLRSYNLIPEPLLASPSLAAINQTAAILSYVTSWAFRLPGMSIQRRSDLDGFVKLCNRMRVSFTSDTGSKDWSFKFVENVRANREIAD